MPSIIRATTSSGLQIAPDNSGSLQLQTNGTTTALTIDTSQNVGIGTTSPDSKLTVTVADAAHAQKLKSATGIFRFRPYADATNGAIIDSTNTAESAYLPFTMNGSSVRLGDNTGIVATVTGGNFQFNSGYGSVATAYGCRAWVNFNGAGTVAIRASGNVTSITDGGTGNYTINFTNAMTDVNYTVVANAWYSAVSAGIVSIEAPNSSASSKQIKTKNLSDTDTDLNNINVAIFR